MALLHRNMVKNIGLFSFFSFATAFFLLKLPSEHYSQNQPSNVTGTSTATINWTLNSNEITTSNSLTTDQIPNNCLEEPIPEFGEYIKYEAAYQPKDLCKRFAPKVDPKNVDEELVQKLKTALKKWLDVDTRKEECGEPETLAEYSERQRGTTLANEDSWDKFHRQINSCHMYHETNNKEFSLEQLLHDLAVLPVVKYRLHTHGTQTKIILVFENEKKALVKPMRFSRHHESDPDRFYYANYERHNAEIAAFHLDKILGLRHALPTVGRVFNLTEMWEKGDEDFDFYISPLKNICFEGKCKDLCDAFHPLCGNPDLKEGSVQVYLPDTDTFDWEASNAPLKRTYDSSEQVAEWETDNSYCKQWVKPMPAFAHGYALLDYVELAILDFLTGNQDRHHLISYDFFKHHRSSFIALDNGQAFGQPKLDDLNILMPLSQCCVIRPSLLKTLLSYYTGPVSLRDYTQIR